jgi:hypothetical protein
MQTKIFGLEVDEEMQQFPTAVAMKNAVIWDTKTVRNSQKTHYVSATVHSRLMLYEISGFQGGNYEECRLLGYKNLVLTSAG